MPLAPSQKIIACGCRIVAITSAFQADDAGSIPATRSRFWNKMLLNKAHIAQSVEHFLGKEEVTGSNPVMSSSFSVENGNWY